MNDLIPRFFPTLEDKMAFLATRPKPVDYQTSYPDSFVSVLIHGNTFQV